MKYVLIMATALLLTQCTNDPKKIVWGKHCLKDNDGNVAWSYIWVTGVIGESGLTKCKKKP